MALYSQMAVMNINPKAHHLTLPISPFPAQLVIAGAAALFSVAGYATESLPTHAEPLQLLGEHIEPGAAARLSWSPSQTFDGIAVSTPVLVVNGNKPGPVLCLTSAVHGDELNGIEIVRRVVHELVPDELSGSVIGVPIVNLQGFRRSSRYLTDRRDLNRFFPGNPTGSSASRIAHSFFSEVINHCDALVDLHTGSFHRTNLPQLRADLRNDEVKVLANAFGSTVVLHSEGIEGTLRKAASDAGIPTVTLEAGEPMRLQNDAVEHGVKAIHSVLSSLKMKKKIKLWGQPEPVYYQSNWVRADQGGILMSVVKLGQRVNIGDLLGTITDPITNRRDEIHSQHKGRILGMARNQVVMPGFAAYRIGIQTTENDILQSEHPPYSPLIRTSQRDSEPVEDEHSVPQSTQDSKLEDAE